MAYITIEKYIDVDVELDDFDTDDLIEELQRRGEIGNDLPKDLLTTIWQKRRLGQDYQRELDDLIYNGLDRIV